MKENETMTTKDLNNLIRWCCDTDGIQFAKDIYNGDEQNEYKTGKFIDMQTKLMPWIASLDNENRDLLVKAINRKSESCPTCGYYEDDIAWHYEDCPELKENKKGE